MLSLLIPLFFGIPFVLLSDLFPFHRYGMFARVPKEAPKAEIQILLAGKDTIIELKTGSPCLDRGLLKKMARNALIDSIEAGKLLDKLRPALVPFPDSVFIELKKPSGWQRKTIYPSFF
jgi:hypothetical protein